MASKTTLVIGGTGKTGRRVVKRLTGRGLAVRVGSRSGQPRFDWEEPATWKPALRGVSSVYITYQPDLAFSGAAERVHSFTELAVESGVRRLVLLSGRNEPGALRGEEAVQNSGAEWTLVRSSFMNQNFSESLWLEPVLKGELAFPGGDVREPFIDAEDIADIVAEALTGDRHVGQLYEVTGPRLMTFADATRELSRATGREIRYVPLSTEQYATLLREAAVPDDEVTAYSELFSEILDGRSAYLSDGVERALGRKPRDFSAFAHEAATSGVWGTLAEHRAWSAASA